MAKIKNKGSANSTSNSSSDKSTNKTPGRIDINKNPSITSIDSTGEDNRERRDGPGGN
ncbi:MAG: hypothetical protein ACFWTJ_05045 [Lachnoclostridium sp.]|jgi:hypothetical protein